MVVLILLQSIAHIALIVFLFTFSFSQLFICLVVYFLTGSIGMSMTYHRYLSHRSWDQPRWIEILGTFFGTIGLTGSSIAWCSIHREHHQKVDTYKDPHSPVFQPWWRVQFFSMTKKPKLRLVKDLIDDPLHRFFHRYYLSVNIGYSITLLVVLGPSAVLYAHLAPAAILWNAGSAVNTVGHLYGYRSYETKDKSRNNLFLAIITWGEGWHNNHHRFPKRSYYGDKWYELDVTGLTIQMITRITSLLNSGRNI